jgi:hypothetical protein
MINVQTPKLILTNPQGNKATSNGLKGNEKARTHHLGFSVFEEEVSIGGKLPSKIPLTIPLKMLISP